MEHEAVGLIVLGLLGLGVVAAIAAPNSVWYREGRPTRPGRAFGAVWTALAKLGVTPPFIAALETRGRCSGEPRRIPVLLADYAGGERYVVAMLGERSDWVRNVRAAGGEAVLVHRKPRPVQLVEVPVEERAPIIKVYVQRANGARPHIPVPPSAPVEEFAAVADRYPVFRVEAR
ncbi:MAG: nitroreductase/quinone reductase family protein [Hyphomicrobiales bacterium]